MAAIHVSRPGAYALVSKLHRIPIAYPTEHWQDCSGEEDHRRVRAARVARQRSARSTRPPARYAARGLGGTHLAMLPWEFPAGTARGAGRVIDATPLTKYTLVWPPGVA